MSAAVSMVETVGSVGGCSMGVDGAGMVSISSVYLVEWFLCS